MPNLPTLTVQNPQYEVLRTGEYLIRVANLELTESPFEQGKEQLKFTLELLDAPHAGKRLTAYCSLSTAPKAKLLRWAQALLNRTFTAGDALNLADLVGRTARAVVLAKHGEKGEYNKVEDLLAPTQPTPAPQPAQASEGGENEDPFA
jgi:hypothetical protein